MEGGGGGGPEPKPLNVYPWIHMRPQPPPLPPLGVEYFMGMPHIKNMTYKMGKRNSAI